MEPWTKFRGSHASQIIIWTCLSGEVGGGNGMVWVETAYGSGTKKPLSESTANGFNGMHLPGRRATVARHSLIYFLFSLPLFPSVLDFSSRQDGISQLLRNSDLMRIVQCQCAEGTMQKGRKRHQTIDRFPCQFVYKIQATRRWTKRGTTPIPTIEAFNWIPTHV